MSSLLVKADLPAFYVGGVKAKPPKLDFPQHLAALRKQRTLTQQALADRIGVHVVQLRRYESGSSQPTLDVCSSGLASRMYFSIQASVANGFPPVRAVFAETCQPAYVL